MRIKESITKHGTPEVKWVEIHATLRTNPQYFKTQIPKFKRRSETISFGISEAGILFIKNDRAKHWLGNWSNLVSFTLGTTDENLSPMDIILKEQGRLKGYVNHYTLGAYFDTGHNINLAQHAGTQGEIRQLHTLLSNLFIVRDRTVKKPEKPEQVTVKKESFQTIPAWTWDHPFNNWFSINYWRAVIYSKKFHNEYQARKSVIAQPDEPVLEKPQAEWNLVCLELGNFDGEKSLWSISEGTKNKQYPSTYIHIEKSKYLNLYTMRFVFEQRKMPRAIHKQLTVYLDQFERFEVGSPTDVPYRMLRARGSDKYAEKIILARFKTGIILPLTRCTFVDETLQFVAEELNKYFEPICNLKSGDLLQRADWIIATSYGLKTIARSKIEKTEQPAPSAPPPPPGKYDASKPDAL